MSKSPYSKKQDYTFFAFGFVHVDISVPRFVDICYLRQTRRHEDPDKDLYIQSINSDDRVVSFIPINSDGLIVNEFHEFHHLSISRVGEVGTYSVKFTQDGSEELKLVRGFRTACALVLEADGGQAIRSSPFLGLAISQILERQDLEHDLARQSFLLLRNTNGALALRWLSSRKLTGDIKQQIEAEFSREAPEMVAELPEQATVISIGITVQARSPHIPPGVYQYEGRFFELIAMTNLQRIHGSGFRAVILAPFEILDGIFPVKTREAILPVCVWSGKMSDSTIREYERFGAKGFFDSSSPVVLHLILQHLASEIDPT